MNKEQTVRIPFYVESQRGDDRLGTNTNTGAIISDHEAQTQGIPFQQGIPQNQIQQAVEIQLKADKWVVLEKQDGTTDLLTKRDIPKLYPAISCLSQHDQKILFVGLPKVEFKEPEPVKPPAEPPKEQPKPKPNDDWKTAFNINPVKPEPAKAEPVKPPAVKPASVNQTCNTEPKKDKTVWESKFEDIKSATATHKGKGG